MSTKDNATASRCVPGPTDRLEVSLGSRSYSIRIASDSWQRCGEWIVEALPDISHALVVADQAVDHRWAQPLAQQLAQRCRCDLRTVPSGEASKSTAMLACLWDWMLDSGADRRSVVVAVGGGVVGDLAGFAAASYARGIRFVQLPTTLLAMVDSSVGGKTGINLSAGKNMVGAFWQPSLVLIDTATLQTLDGRGYVGGLAEVIKYGVIEDADFFAWLETEAPRLLTRQHEAVATAIRRSCSIKAAVVAADEREVSGRRAVLNYGHTFAHAIEATAGYGTFTHGEAVAIGMAMAARLAKRLGRVDDALIGRQDALLTACGLPVRWAQADPEAMISVMKTDKKVAHATLRFVLPTGIGHVELVPCQELHLVEQAIRDCR